MKNEKLHALKCNIKNDNNCDCDGYHTFNELYEHRAKIFITLCSLINKSENWYKEDVWYSKLHFDSSMFEGMFIIGISNSITYHLDNKYLDICKEKGFKYLEKAQEWNGHTSDDVLKNLLELF
jgi:hypothetical protein